MNKSETLVLSTHLSLESVDKDIESRVIVNTLTGQRVQITQETMKILEAFRVPRTLPDAATSLGIDSRDGRRQLRSLVSPLRNACLLVGVSDTAGHEQGSLRAIVDEDCLVRSKTTFAHCPSMRVAEVEEDTVVITGVGVDQATTGHPGARFGAERLREVSTRFITYDRDIFTLTNRGWYLADTGKNILEGIPFADVGNVVHQLSENARGLYERCYRAALSIHQRKALPVFIGGDHSISAPLILACRKVHEDIALIHFDAHTDLGEWDASTTHHHGNVMSRVLHENPKLEISQFGIRGFAGAPPSDGSCLTVRQADLDADLSGIISTHIPRGQKCYISLDVDVLDPSIAPGTGTPVPMGMMPRTLLSLLQAVAMYNRVVGIDVVELCPGLDRDDMTTSLVFHILYVSSRLDT